MHVHCARVSKRCWLQRHLWLHALLFGYRPWCVWRHILYSEAPAIEQRVFAALQSCIGLLQGLELQKAQPQAMSMADFLQHMRF